AAARDDPRLLRRRRRRHRHWLRHAHRLGRCALRHSGGTSGPGLPLQGHGKAHEAGGARLHEGDLLHRADRLQRTGRAPHGAGEPGRAQGRARDVHAQLRADDGSQRAAHPALGQGHGRAARAPRRRARSGPTREAHRRLLQQPGLSGGRQGLLREAPPAVPGSLIAPGQDAPMPPQSLKIDNARYVVIVDRERRIMQDGSILIEDGKVRRVGKAASLANAQAERVIDARHLVVTPGFVNGHMHISYAHAVRGIFPDNLASPLNHVFKLQTAMTEEEEHATTLLGLVELLKSGTVCFVDPGSTKFPDACLQAYEDAGIRVILGECVSDQEAPFPLPRYAASEAATRTGAFLDKWHGRLDGRIRAWAMPFSPETCPRTAAKGGRGVPEHGRMPELLAKGGKVALGCDSPNNSHHLDIVRAMNMAAIQYKDARQDTRLIPAEAALEMATLVGAQALGVDDEIGSIEPGKKADLVLFDTQRPEWQALFNPINNLVYNADGRSVHTVIVDGRVRVDAYRQTFVDEPRLFAQVQEIGEKLQRRTGTTFPRSRWPIL